MTMRFGILCACLLVLVGYSGAPSQDKPPDRNQEFAAKAFAAVAAGYNARDAKAIAESFTPTGEFVDGEANVFQGREAIAREFTALFAANPKASIKLDADDVREISPGVLTADGTARVAGEATDPSEIDFVAILVRQADGRWLLASIRSLGESDEETPHGRLTDLEWLIGEWVDESDESTMHMTSRWSEDGNFIVTDFAIRVAGRNVMTGTQRIGWDGSTEKFKSWVFDSAGGHAEGIWTELDDQWVVKTTGVRPDGAAGSATHTYERKGADAFYFKVSDRIVGDERQPDFVSHVVRKPPEPEKAGTAATPGGK